MSSNEIYVKVQSLLSEKFHGNADVRRTTALTDLGLDSLTHGVCICHRGCL